MVEQPQRGMCKDHPMLIRRLDTFRVHHTSTWRSEVLHPTLPRPVDIIREGEERVTRTCDAIQLLSPFLLLLNAQRLDLALKQTLPVLLLASLELFS